MRDQVRRLLSCQGSHSQQHDQNQVANGRLHDGNDDLGYSVVELCETGPISWCFLVVFGLGCSGVRDCWEMLFQFMAV